MDGDVDQVEETSVTSLGTSESKGSRLLIQGSEFKHRIQGVRDNPFATEAAKIGRAEFETDAETKIKQFEQEFPEYEMVIGLTGSIQAGMTEKSGSDIDLKVFIRRKDGRAYKQVETVERQRQINNYTNQEQGMVYDLAELKTLYASHIIKAGTFNEAILTDQEGKWWFVGDPVERTQEFLLAQGEQTTSSPDLFPLVTLFNYTSTAQETSGIADSFREEILRVIAQRPDSEIFWQIVQVAWNTHNVWYENINLAGKPRMERVMKAIGGAISKRREEKQSKKRQEPLEITPDVIGQYYERLEKIRGKFIPGIKEMLETYGIAKT